MTQATIDLIIYFQDKVLYYDQLLRSEKETSRRALYRRMKADYKRLIRKHLKKNSLPSIGTAL